MDTRLQQLSYSSLLTLHSCPRKFQLDRLQAPQPELDTGSSVTFAYGHAVGAGIQFALDSTLSQDQVIFQTYLAWDADLADENPKQNKTFWEALAAVQKFIEMRERNFLKGWQLVWHPDSQGVMKPAVELSFLIHLPNGYKYRGFVDAVLQHETTGEIMVLECKTTSANSLNAATYKNSAQAIGYSIVLDHLFPEASSYDVLYLVYKTKSREYEMLPFTKSYLQRALWIRELLLDLDIITLYEAAEIYPMRGESCYNFYRECEYLLTCTLATEKLTDPLTVEAKEGIMESHSKYQIHITLDNLIDSQLKKEEEL